MVMASPCSVVIVPSWYVRRSVAGHVVEPKRSSNPGGEVERSITSSASFAAIAPVLGS